MLHRRHFIQQSSALIGGSLAASAFGNSLFAQSKKLSPNEQINVAAIGINGMGWSDLVTAATVPGVNVVGVCDIDPSVIDMRMKEMQKYNIDASKVKVYKDYRKMLEQKDIDVIIIGTPDHWHALMMTDACAAGKDVYCEKPIGNSIEECRAMLKAQHRYNRVVQVGQWQRSQQHFKNAVDYVHSGKLGNIRTVKVWCYQGWMQPGPVVPDSAPPAGVDYAAWLGPAQKRPFNSSRFHFNFRWFWDYAGGLMTDWGVHLLDYGLLGMNVSTPKSVSALGGRFAYPDLYEETPDTLTTLYEFENFNMVWDSAMGIGNGSYGRDHGIAYIGNNGTLILNRSGWEVIEESSSKNKAVMPLEKSMDNGLQLHLINFIDVVRSRKMSNLHCPASEAVHIATVAQMGNIAYRSGRKLEWDSVKEKFTDDAINKQYFAKEYHNGYKLPKV